MEGTGPAAMRSASTSLLGVRIGRRVRVRSVRAAQRTDEGCCDWGRWVADMSELCARIYAMARHAGDNTFRKENNDSDRCHVVAVRQPENNRAARTTTSSQRTTKVTRMKMDTRRECLDTGTWHDGKTGRSSFSCAHAPPKPRVLLCACHLQHNHCATPADVRNTAVCAQHP